MLARGMTTSKTVEPSLVAGWNISGNSQSHRKLNVQEPASAGYFLSR
jgi:hypothetical protein